MKLSKLILTLVFAACAFFIGKHYLLALSFHPAKSPINQNNDYTLLVFTSRETIGGGRVYVANLCKELARRGQRVIGLTSHSAPVQEDFRKAGVPFYTCNPFRVSRNKRYWQPGLYHAIHQICKNHTISIVHCNDTFELAAAQKVNKHIPLKTLFVSHVAAAPKALDYVEKADARIAVEKNYAKKVNATFLPPFLNEDMFVQTDAVRVKSLEDEFGIKLKQAPTLCMLARFDNRMEKEQPLFLKAIASIVHDKKRSVNAILAGDGPSIERCKKLAHKLNITEYVHFLGGVPQKKIPLILHQSDINLLIRRNEAFGIALLEASLTKTPSIIADTAGAANTFIFDKKTGLLFKHGNKEDLVEKIITLMDDPAQCKLLGEASLKLFEKSFSRNHTITKIISIYDQLRKKREAV